MRSSAAARPPRKPRAAPRCCRFTHSHDFTRSSAAWRTSKQPASSVRTAAGADAHAFESLLAAGQSSNAAVQDRPVASATTAAAAAAAASVDVEGTGDLLPPILPLHRGAERFAWAAPDGALLEVIVRRGVLQDDSHGGSSGAGALERCAMIRVVTGYCGRGWGFCCKYRAHECKCASRRLALVPHGPSRPSRPTGP